MSDTATIDRLDAIVARLEALGLMPPPAIGLAAVDPDGFPGNVAAGELIESAWGNAVANSMRGLPRGQLALNTKASDEGGFGSTTYGISGLGFSTPSKTGRISQGMSNVRVVVTTAGANDTVISFSLHPGSIANGAVASWLFGFPQNPTAYGMDFLLTTPPLGLAVSTGYVLSTSTNGLGRYTVKGGTSWSALYDVT